MIRVGRYSAEQKLDLIRRHRLGERLDLGTDQYGRDLLAKWEDFAPVDAPEEATLSRLRWTEDDGEIPTLEILRERAGVFPTGFLRPGMRALCLFCARFYGRSDVIQVYDSGAAHATLVDSDAQKLEEMRLLYPSHWSYVAGDYAEYLERIAAGGGRFDIIIADTWRSMAEDVAWNRLPEIMRMTPLFLVNYFDTMFEKLGIAPEDHSGLATTLSHRIGVPLHVLEVMPRNSAVCWVVIERSHL